MANIDIEWNNFLNGMETNVDMFKNSIPKDIEDIENIKKPVCEDLYISTKTKVLYLNQQIDIHRIFWLIPIIEYWEKKLK